MEWHHETSPCRYVFTTGAYQAIISLSVEQNSWISYVQHDGRVVRAAIFPVLLISQAWCIAQIVTLQAVDTTQPTDLDDEHLLEPPSVQMQPERAIGGSKQGAAAVQRRMRRICQPVFGSLASGTGQGDWTSGYAH
jgi:hypothetical protein